MATDVLKPGGYERFSQMAGEFGDLDGKPSRASLSRP